MPEIGAPGLDSGGGESAGGGVMSGYFVGWGTLALLNAALANIDGRSPLKYFLVSLLFGPFVTLLLAVTREDGKEKLRQVNLWGGRRKR